MEEYTSNSHKSREAIEDKTLPEKKVEAVVSAPVKTKKRGGFRKFTDVIVAEDAANVKSYIFTDVLIPAIKKAISDIFSNGIDMLLYGEPGRSKRGNTASKISYRSYYDLRDDRRDDYRDGGVSVRNPFDYDDIIFDSRGDAEIVLNTMEALIDQYGVASVGDLYDLANVSTTNYTVNKYGWTNIRTAQVIRSRDGYLLKMPKAMPIN